MARFGKKVLSQYLRTKCDKQLLLSLYKNEELQELGWPIRIEARPTGRILRDRGNEWEQAKVQDLEAAFSNHLRGIKKDRKYIRMPLEPVLSADPVSPTFIIQGRFEDPNLKTTFLQNIGLEPVQSDSIPQFTAFEPDIMVIRAAAEHELEILPDGNFGPIPVGSERKAILVFDIKHVGEANSSYSSEVVLYAVLLANWLRLRDLETQFFVSESLGLGTRAKETSELSRLVGTNPEASITDRLHAFLADIEWVDFGVFFQGVDHFIKQDLPRVLAVSKWTDLDWHLDSRCSTCDFLGHREWLPAEDRAVVDAYRDHYCETAAEDSGHLSRITTITRGSRKTLCEAGYADLGAISRLSSSDLVFKRHNALKADRNHLPQRASALISGNVTVAPGTTTIDFPKSADLEVFITVNFDPGTGLLSALLTSAYIMQ